MAWLDDRAWCHPKFTDLSAEAFRVYWCGVSYSSGMSTGGVLSPAQQRMLGSDEDIYAELVAAVLWNVRGTDVEIHDWADHNGKRDARKAADRERKRLARLADRDGIPPAVPADSPTDSPADAPPEKTGDDPQDGSALKEVKEVTGEGSEQETGEPLRAAARDPMWDALTQVIGECTNDLERGRRNTALKALRQSGATPSGIRLRASRYARAWPDIALTAMGLATNWDTFAVEPNGQTPTRIATMFDEEEPLDASAGRALGSGD